MLKNSLGRILAYGFLAFLVYYVATNPDLLKPLLEVSPIVIILIGLLKLILMLINGLFTKLTLEAFDISISQKESAYISLLSSLGNYFGPLLGGMGVRAAYLKQKYGFAITHFAGTIYGYYLVTFFTTALIGLISLWVINAQTGASSSVVTAALVAITSATGVLLIIRLPQNSQLSNKRYLGWIYRRLSQVNEGWEKLLSHPGLIGRLLLLSLVVFLIGLGIVYLEFLALGLSVSTAALVLYAVLGSLSVLVSFTPGAIGIREAVYVFSAGVLALTNSQILQVAAIDRGTAVMVLLLSYVYLQFFKISPTLKSQQN
jgi:uncharacterized protein (TIRG00374 family)